VKSQGMKPLIGGGFSGGEGFALEEKKVIGK
jgi:hypothetical protein